MAPSKIDQQHGFARTSTLTPWRFRLYIDATGKVERSESHPKSHPVLAERVEGVIHQMQEENFCWIPRRENGKTMAFTLEFMLNFGITCQDPM